MSGIFGLTYRSADHAVIKDAMEGLDYWNRIYGDADKHSVQIFGNSGLGCRVEHFSDCFPAGEPILTISGSPAVVDALLFNRDELLSSLGMPADSLISDEQLLLTLIERKGYPALRQVNGDFAGAVFDEARQEWTLFRDHMGVRPLFYYTDNDLIVFSTDLRAIVSVPGVDASVDGRYVFDHVQSINYLTQTGTEYRHIRAIHPGSITRIRLDRDRCRFRQKLYWRVRERKIRLASDEAYIRRMRELVTDAVNRRCDAIPGILGAELSGGLDSCTIDILINRYGRDAVYYSWSMPPDVVPLYEDADERQIIFDVCRQENITCQFSDPNAYIYFIDQVNAHMPAYVNTPNLVIGSRWMHSQGARVVFSGHGGDEGVSHRAPAFELLYNLELWSYFKIHWMYLKGKKLRFLRAIRSAYQEAIKEFKLNFSRAKAESLYLNMFKDEFAKRMLRESNLRRLPFRYAPHKLVHQGGCRFRLETCAYMGSYSGVRYLFPFIDYRVMDFALSIPRRLYKNHEIDRLIFRQAFADIMPESLRDLRYKNIPSRRGTMSSEMKKAAYQKNLNALLEYLDEDVWSEMLDFDGIRGMLKQEFSDDMDLYMHNFVITNLRQCIMIQDIQKNAQRWRELDKENV